MTFDELPVGAKFRLWRGGTLLTKASVGGYLAPLYGQEEKAIPDAEVIPEDDGALSGALAARKVDDVVFISKALDALEIEVGRTSELIAARHALRRLATQANLKTGH
ncbi:hypothetical protein [Variovorax saccharolyticus]|uniref:hypothetical protein n=1 Tax=Variovorax saccharolyticus TaxID=3053516 RepID=UPI002576A836|nr:hypothetical protein [Variovorax sp. J31P216]MDM0030439.1 hypothetical protein [Variovorax sp. J31P216]